MVNMKTQKKVRKIKKAVFIVSMLIVPTANLLLFWFYVNFNSILLAFQMPQADGTVLWGFGNFIRFFREFGNAGSEILESIKNTVVFFIANIAVTLPVSLFLCYFLYKKIRGYKFFRFVFYLPAMITAAVYVVLFKYIISAQGLVGNFFKLFGSPNPPFLTDSRYALGTILFYTVFTSFGSNIVLLSGAMSHIDESIIEAGKIDGVTLSIELFSIVLPLVWPTLSTLVIFAFVGIFSASGPILLFTGGAYKTNTLSYWLYAQVQRYAVYNYPSAVGLFFTCIGAPIALFMRWIMGFVPTYDE